MKKITPLKARVITIAAQIIAASFCIGATGFLGSAAADVLLSIGILLFIAAVIFDGVYCRCPKCGRYLPKSCGFAKYCPDCGEDIKK